MEGTFGCTTQTVLGDLLPLMADALEFYFTYMCNVLIHYVRTIIVLGSSEHHSIQLVLCCPLHE
jgi:hypothetical protein